MSLDLSGITKLESRSRTVHVAWDGLEIQREFHVIPFGSGPAFVEALQGSVFREPDGQWVRRLPAVDPFYSYCYCNEARIDQIDPAKESIGVSPSLDLHIDENEPVIPNVVNYERVMTAVNETKEEAAGGCFVHASYRPLISAYTPPSEGALELHRSRMFDWIDPQWLPGFKTVAWPDGMGVIVRHWITGLPAGVSLPEGVADQVTVPISEFSVRRLLIGNVPWDTISGLSNCVNSSDWPVTNAIGADHIRFKELFKKGTLKFDGAEIVEHYSPASLDGFWYEIIYHFQWLHLEEPNVYGTDGRIDPRGIVTWNHVLITPDQGILDKLGVLRSDPGWYIVEKFDLANWAPWLFGSTAGTLYKSVNFDQLFDLQAP